MLYKDFFLKKGDVIGAIAPASFVTEDQIQKICTLVEKEGYKLKIAKNASLQWGYLAGNDQERAQGTMELWRDPQVKILWCLRGGFGSAKILPLIDFDTVLNKKKALVGMSDITALHLAFLNRMRFPSFLAPNLTLLLKEDPDSTKMKQDVFSSLQSPSRYFSIMKGGEKGGKILNYGRGLGEFIGGNLTVLCSLVGTKWFPCLKNKILLLEDVNEAPYRIDRMLFQLEEVGVLKSLSGLIFASFDRCHAEDSSKSLDLETIFKIYVKDKKYPVLLGYPSGHLPFQKTLACGLMAELVLSYETTMLKFQI